ncbi:MAG TPA: CC/Se motif family (seleno)protein [Anaeromyxobacteraceae bacterium]|nr:CC/Se motif family (seleno)protein [Anaeromyxobacteraceae bacterium]
MLSISPEARALILEKGAPVRLELSRAVHGGCGVPPLQERPTVRFGPPPSFLSHHYEARDVDGITFHVPRALPKDRPLTVGVASFLGIRRLVVEGWNPLGWEP